MPTVVKVGRKCVMKEEGERAPGGRKAENNPLGREAGRGRWLTDLESVSQNGHISLGIV